MITGRTKVIPGKRYSAESKLKYPDILKPNEKMVCIANYGTSRTEQNRTEQKEKMNMRKTHLHT